MKKKSKEVPEKKLPSTADNSSREGQFWSDLSQREKAADQTLEPMLKVLYDFVKPLRAIAQDLGPEPGDLPTGLIEEGLTDGYFYFCKALDALGAVSVELETSSEQHHNLAMDVKHKKVGYRVRSGKAVEHAS